METVTNAVMKVCSRDQEEGQAIGLGALGVHSWTAATCTVLKKEWCTRELESVKQKDFRLGISREPVRAETGQVGR
jgi:hypothetical protein